ncbi:MAG: LysR substrate-binding domain-containing protein [Archangium sp.]|nr:LysR substrate-binding domain-containing protein [Archangium sp.]MDP3570730.1 LysR substrate-binding domain-containing protein [Archangium sp.]
MRLVPHPITLRQLQYVVAVADQKSFRKAALACHVSQPALSAQVAQLEGALECKLFDRDTQRVLVSSAGRAFVERARELLIKADALVDETQRAGDPLAGPLRLGIIPTVGPYLLPEVAQPLRTEFPRLRFTWVEERTAVLMKLLKEGELDGAIVALETEDLGEVQSLVLGRDSFFLATPNDHALARGKTPVSTQVLEKERVLVLEEGHCLGEQVAEVCQRARTSELDVCATSLATLAQMVVGGAGVTLLPALALEVENRRGTLHLRPFIAKAPGRTLALVWRKSSTAHGALKAIAPTLRKSVTR